MEKEKEKKKRRQFGQTKIQQSQNRGIPILQFEDHRQGEPESQKKKVIIKATKYAVLTNSIGTRFK